MSDFTRLVAQTVGKHFVTLSCIQYPYTEEPESLLLFSGFIVEIHGEWFYITAGHILCKIRIAIEAGSVFDVWRFDDQTAGNKFGGKAVPYDFHLEEWLIIRDKTKGLDYAAVHLGGLYRQQLEVGGVVPIKRSAWLDPYTKHDYWVLVGVPSETVIYDGTTEITARLVMSPLEPAEAPHETGEKVRNRFYAKLKEGKECPFENADGLSGGPVFTLKKMDGKWRYGVIGVQSAWNERKRTLAICPFSSFGTAIEDAMAEALKNSGQRTEDG